MLSIDPITPSIGAEVSGLDFSRPISVSMYDEVYRALLQHLVIFIRGTDISPGIHIEFAQNFGDLDDPDNGWRIGTAMVEKGLIPLSHVTQKIASLVVPHTFPAGRLLKRSN